jgi:hypothetical protein
MKGVMRAVDIIRSARVARTHLPCRDLQSFVGSYSPADVLSRVYVMESEPLRLAGQNNNSRSIRPPPLSSGKSSRRRGAAILNQSLATEIGLQRSFAE